MGPDVPTKAMLSKQNSFTSGQSATKSALASAGEPLPQEMWSKTARLEGVLNSVRSEIDRFVEILAKDPNLHSSNGTSAVDQGPSKQQLLDLKSRATKLEQELAKGVSDLQTARDGNRSHTKCE